MEYSGIMIKHFVETVGAVSFTKKTQVCLENLPGFPNHFWKFERLNLRTSLWVGRSEGMYIVTYYIILGYVIVH